MSPPCHAAVGQKSCSGMDGVALITSCCHRGPGVTPCQRTGLAPSPAGVGAQHLQAPPGLLGEEALRKGAGNGKKRRQSGLPG